MQTETSPNNLIQWTPRTKDIPQYQSPERDDFLFVLTTAINTIYTVKPEDSLDRIIRNQFFVSGISQPRAYTAYKQNIQARNHGSLRVLQPMQKLYLPSGPHYAALESSIDTPQEYLGRMIDAFISKDCGPNNKRGKCSLPPPRPSLTAATLDSRTYFTIFQNLGHFARVYPSPDESFTITRWRRKAAVNELLTRKVLPPSVLRPGIDQELVSVYVPPSVEIPSGLWPSSGPDALPQFGDTILDPADTCTAKDCTKCSQLLNYVPVASPLKGKLLLADTGVDSDVLSPLGLYYAPIKNPLTDQKDPSSRSLADPQDVPQPETPTNLLDFSDPSSDHHGTFIYGEIVNGAGGGGGLLPAGSVDFARVTVPQPYPYLYGISVRHVVASMHRFVSDNLSPKSGGYTWIASFSFGGDVKDVEQSQLGLIQTSHILYVVAAGNVLPESNTRSGPQSTETETQKLERQKKERLIGENYVYPKFNGPLNNLLVVGALNSGDHLASYSKISPYVVDIFARGSCVCGGHGKMDNDRSELYGTSQAAPLAAAAALILGDHKPTWTAQQIKWRLISTSDFQDDLFVNGIGGKLNLAAALDYRSLITRAPLSAKDAYNKKGTVGEKVKAFVSDNQEEVSRVDESTGSAWRTLLDLDGSSQVLRLHKVTSSCSKGFSCFRRIKLEGGAEPVSVEDTAPLVYYDKDNNKIGPFQAKDLVDVVFTFKP